MLGFTLFGFPVRVQWTFWLTAVLLSGRWNVGGTKEIIALVLWVAAAFVSILAHELGHTFFQRKYGSYPWILLHGMGGLAIPEGGRGFTRKESMVISAAGPLVQLALGIGIVALLIALPAGSGSFYTMTFLKSLSWVSITWAIFNMLPILPMDGGRFFEALTNGNLRLVGWVGTIVGGALAVWMFSGGQPFLAIFLGWMGYQNFQAARNGYWGDSGL